MSEVNFNPKFYLVLEHQHGWPQMIHVVFRLASKPHIPTILSSLHSLAAIEPKFLSAITLDGFPG